MRSIVRDFSAAASEKSAAMVRGPFNSGGGGGGNPIFGGSGGGVDGGGPLRSPSLIHHQEQYRHYTGWVHACIRPIAQSIARQPVRIARVQSAAQPVRQPSGVKRPVIQTPYGPFDREYAVRQMYFKKHLPGPLKQYYETAELLESHPLLDAIDNPNELMVRWSLMFCLTASLELTGKHYWWVRSVDDPNSRLGKRLVIWPLPSHWCAPKHTKDKLFAYWEVRPEGQTQPFNVPVEQIVYFYLPDPSNPFGAYATLQAQAKAVVSDESISEAQRQSFARGIFPGYAIVAGRLPDAQGNAGMGEKPLFNKEQRNQLLNMIKQQYRGVYHHDEPIILDQLIQDIKRITNSPREMDFMQSGAVTKERITQAFGVNPIVLGQVEGANRASSAAAADHLNDIAVNPKIELISQCLTAWFNPLFARPGEKLIVYLEEAWATDPDSDRLDWGMLAEHYACSRNELRAGLMHLPPIPDGDALLVPMDLIPLDITQGPDRPSAPNQVGTKPTGKHVDRVSDENSVAECPVPLVEQSEMYDCGAASSRSVAELYEMCAGWSELDFITALESDATIGTEPADIVAFFRHRGCQVWNGPHWAPTDLWRHVRAGRPVICCIQGMTFGNERDRENFDNGHWVVVDHLTVDGVRYMDPATGGHEYATWSDWLRNWRDRGADGTSYERYGIAVGSPPHDLHGNPARSAKSAKGYVCFARMMSKAERLKHWDAVMVDGEAELKQAFIKFFDSERERIAAALSNWGKSNSDAFDDLISLTEPFAPLMPYGPTAVKSEHDEAAERLIAQLVPVAGTTDKMLDMVTPALTRVVLSGAEREWADMKPEDGKMVAEWARKPKPKPAPDRTPLPKEIRSRCQDYVGDMVVNPYWQDMTRRTRLQMAREVRRGVAHGESHEQIEARVLAVVSPENDAVRAAMIARTEATGAINIGQQAAREHLTDLGLVAGKQWSALHRNTRESHLSADGQTVKATKKFKVGGERCDFPGDPNLSPGERCNCQCVALTIPVD